MVKRFQWQLCEATASMLQHCEKPRTHSGFGLLQNSSQWLLLIENPSTRSVCKALVCSNQTWISWEALLLGAGNRSATAVWRHIKPPCVCQPSAQCIAWFPFLHHLTTHLPPHPPSKGYLPTYTTAPLSKQIQWNALFHSGFNDAWDSKEPALFRTHNSTLY